MAELIRHHIAEDDKRYPGIKRFGSMRSPLVGAKADATWGLRNRGGVTGQVGGKEAALKTATDSEVIAASAADPEAFRDLFERHFSMLVRYLRRRVGRETAEDLAVETFVLAFRRRHAYDHAHESARPWLFGIATNLLATTGGPRAAGCWPTPGPTWTRSPAPTTGSRRRRTGLS